MRLSSGGLPPPIAAATKHTTAIPRRGQHSVAHEASDATVESPLKPHAESPGVARFSAGFEGSGPSTSQKYWAYQQCERDPDPDRWFRPVIGTSVRGAILVRVRRGSVRLVARSGAAFAQATGVSHTRAGKPTNQAASQPFTTTSNDRRDRASNGVPNFQPTPLADAVLPRLVVTCSLVPRCSGFIDLDGVLRPR